MRVPTRNALLLLLGFQFFTAVALAAPRCAHFDPQRRAFFGDLHVHTTYSLDAATLGTPRDAYALARGSPVGERPGLHRPLDFAAVTDHAEWLGEMRLCRDPEHPAYTSDICWSYREVRDASVGLLAARAKTGQRFDFCGDGGEACREAARAAWRDTVEAADEAQDRTQACAFSAFPAWEWTGTVDDGKNLHRNVVFRSSEVPRQPLGYVEAPSPQALWSTLRRDCGEVSGCDVLAIPHNSNLSGGAMFASGNPQDHAPLSRQEAQQRAELEPLIEIMQHKGDSECLLRADSRDEACGFEKVPYDRFAGAIEGPRSWDRLTPTPAATVREALKQGLTLESQLGVNPFAFGLLASTDTHTGRPGSVSEARYAGHTSTNKGEMKGSLPDVLQYNPGGLAGIFAEQNTRDSLFAAMRRKEVFGTSGPRIVVRFFAGRYPDDLCSRSDFVEIGYDGGVPMGGRLSPDSVEGSPVFAITAAQDAGTPQEPGNGLQRVQIVKGWLEAGAAHERVIDVAAAAPNAQVDTATCEPSAPGAATLCAVWRDPDFDATQSAFYYARVLEIPSCRWSQRVCNARGVDCAVPDTVPADLAPCCHPLHRRSIQERAWTSPIWYEGIQRAAASSER